MSSSAMILKFVGGAGVLIVGCCVYAYCKRKSNSVFKQNPHEMMREAKEIKPSIDEKLHLDETVLMIPGVPQDTIAELIQLAEVLAAPGMNVAEVLKSLIVEKPHLDETVLINPGSTPNFTLELLEIGEIFLAAGDVANAVEHLSHMVAISSHPWVELEGLEAILHCKVYDLIKKKVVASDGSITKSTFPKNCQAISKPRLLIGKLCLKKGDFVNGAKHISNLMEICFEPQQLMQALEKSLSPEIYESLNKEMKKLNLAKRLES